MTETELRLFGRDFDETKGEFVTTSPVFNRYMSLGCKS